MALLNGSIGCVAAGSRYFEWSRLGFNSEYANVMSHVCNALVCTGLMDGHCSSQQKEEVF